MKTAVIPAPILTVKNVRSCRGHDADAWSAVLYIDGKRACEVADDSYGGEYHIHWFSDDRDTIKAWQMGLRQAGIEWGLSASDLPYDEDDAEPRPWWDEEKTAHILKHRYDDRIPPMSDDPSIRDDPNASMYGVADLWQCVVGDLVVAVLEAKEIKGWCRNGIPFRNPAGDGKSWRTVSAKWKDVEAMGGWEKLGKTMLGWDLGCSLADLEFAHVTYKGEKHPFKTS
jgi:hypothetical protein